MTVRPSATARRARVLLLSVLSLGILLFGIVAMHAQMVGADAPIGDTMTVSAAAPHTDGTRSAGTAAMVMDVMQHGMAAMDCLVLGMMCLFGVAVLLLLALAGRPDERLADQLGLQARDLRDERDEHGFRQRDDVDG